MVISIHYRHVQVSLFFFFNDTATTEIYTLSLHDALPISVRQIAGLWLFSPDVKSITYGVSIRLLVRSPLPVPRSEEHTSELQSHLNLVCRLLLEKKNTSTTSEQSGLRFGRPAPSSYQSPT